LYNYRIMLKNTVIVAVAALLAAFAVTAQPNKTAGGKEDPAPDKNPAIVLTAPEHQSDRNADKRKADSDSPYWYAPLEKPDWWVLSVAIVTGVIICWQSWETRKAAQAANKSIEVSKTKERAKLLLSPQPLNPVVGAIPEAKLLITNVGESNALIGLSISGLHVSESDFLVKNGCGYYSMKIENRLMEPKEMIEETVWWPAHPFAKYSQEVLDDKQVVHMHGMIRFRDAFDDSWGVDFHFIWRSYRTPVWFPHLQAHKYGDWEDQDKKGEYPIPKTAKRRWWNSWPKVASLLKTKPSDPN
jgi:hypothetical protein